MRYKLKTFVVLWGTCLSMGAYGQCTEDSQCPVGYYCEVSAVHCHKCLSCEDYKRESPLQRDLCVKSILQCGNCFKGLVEDPRMEHACVPPLGAEAGALPSYVWAVIGLVLLAFVLCAVAYVVFKKDTLFQYILKIRATTSVHSTCGSAAGAGVPSAPELAPPPYDELYAPPAPAPGPAEHATAHVVDEDSRPFIKRVPSARARGAGGRESADSQAARPFNKPAYIRGPQTSYNQSDESEPASPPFTPHDEDTMESLWTPNENSNNVVNNTNSSAVAEGASAAAGDARAHSSDDEGPPAKTLCVREDSNNNRGRESSTGAHSGPAPSAAPTVLISVVNNFTSFDQRNNLNLPRH